MYVCPEVTYTDQTNEEELEMIFQILDEDDGYCD